MSRGDSGISSQLRTSRNVSDLGKVNSCFTINLCYHGKAAKTPGAPALSRLEGRYEAMSTQQEPGKHQSRIPQFKSYVEEADWWDTTDTGAPEYEQEFQPVNARFSERLTRSYPDIVSLRGAAGSLNEPLSWQKVQEIAQEDRLEG
jgi:hypothetical protein